MKNCIETKLKANACRYVMSEHPFFAASDTPADEIWAEWYDKAVSHRIDFDERTAAGDYAYRATAEFDYFEIPTALVFVYDIMRFAMKGLNDG